MTLLPGWVRWSAFGLLALQLGWIFALPPFRGTDEFDHAYRADAVAHGEWVARPEAATRGTGAVLSVSKDLVDAAQPECQRQPYTGPEDCVGRPDGDRMAIASGAGRYNPLYYVMVGYPGSLLDGLGALYLMRALSALLCTGLLAWALASLGRWTGHRGPLAVLLTLTPMIVYSTAVVAPNGLEMVAGLAFWVALGGLAQTPEDDQRNLALAVVSGVLLVSLRSMGPLWAGLILGTAMLAWPELRGRAPSLVRSSGGRLTIGVGLLTGLASVMWILSQRSLIIGTEEVRHTLSLAIRLKAASAELLLWPLQAIAAFPRRSTPAPVIVYASYALLLLGVIIVGMARTARAPRRAMLTVIVLSFGIPWVITVATVATFGTAWQGRYALPYLVGAAVLAGDVWARRRSEIGWKLMAPAIVLVVIGQTAGPVAVLLSEVENSPLAGTDAWGDPHPVLLGGIFVVGALMLTVPLARAVTRERAAS